MIWAGWSRGDKKLRVSNIMYVKALWNFDLPITWTTDCTVQSLWRLRKWWPTKKKEQTEMIWRGVRNMTTRTFTLRSCSWLKQGQHLPFFETGSTWNPCFQGPNSIPIHFLRLLTSTEAGLTPDSRRQPPSSSASHNSLPPVHHGRISGCTGDSMQCASTRAHRTF